MSEIAKHVERFIIENWERFFWVMVGGWIQIYLATKKGVKFSKLTVVGSLLLSAFVGYWAGEIAEIYNLTKMSNFIASISAIGAHSILNFYSDNIETWARVFVKRVFNIKIDEKKDSRNSK